MRLAAVAAASLAALAAGCSMTIEDMGGLYSAPPGKYDVYDCNDLTSRMRTTSEREAELNSLMARAGQDAAGQLVNLMVYQEELNIVRSNKSALRRALDDRRCASDVIVQPALLPLH